MRDSFLQICHLLAWILVGSCFSVLADSPAEFKTGNDGIYWLITDDKGDAIYSSGDKSPLYEGDLKIRGKPVTVFSSLQSLELNHHLPSDLQPLLKSPIAKSGIELQVSAKSVADLLKHFQDQPDSFLKFFSGMAEAKAKLFQSLLFSSKVVLKKEDLEILRRNAWEPKPPPFSIPLKFHFKGSEPPKFFSHFQGLYQRLMSMADHFYEASFSIQVGSLEFELDSKSIEFDPMTQTFFVILSAHRARLQGVIHEIGEFKDLTQYRHAKELPWVRDYFRVWDKQKILLKGDIVNSDPDKSILELRIKLGFGRDANGLWRIQLPEPLRIKMKEDNPSVSLQTIRPEWLKNGEPPQYAPEDVEPKAVHLSEDARQEIETTLNHTLQETFASAFFSNDLGFRINLGREDVDHGSTAVLETELSKVQVTKDGLVVGFDPSIKLYQPAKCLREADPFVMKNFNFQAMQARKTESQEIVSVGKWLLTSLPSLKMKDAMTPWFLSEQNSTPQIEFDLSADAIQKINEGAYLGGLYCFRTRDFWPRVNVQMPELDLVPVSPPVFTDLPRGQSGKTLKIAMNMTTYSRNWDFYREKFVPTLPSSLLQLEYPLQMNSAERKILSPGIQNFQFDNFSKKENEWVMTRMNNLIREAVAKILPLPPEAFGFQLNFEDLQKTFTDRVRVNRIDWNEEGLKINLNPADFDWLPVRSHGEAEQTTSPTFKYPPLRFAQDLPKQVSESHISIRWEQETHDPDVLYSTLLRSPGELEWSKNWTDFEKTRSRSIALTNSGRYEFAVKFLSPEGISEPEVFEFSYNPVLAGREAEPSETVSPIRNEEKPKSAKESSAQSTPSKDEGRAPSKGLFGCSLKSDESFSVSHLILLVSFLIFSLALRRRFVRRRPAS